MQQANPDIDQILRLQLQMEERSEQPQIEALVRKSAEVKRLWS